MVNTTAAGSGGQGQGGLSLDEADRASMEACCEGLEPVLKAVDELPSTGTSPPASARNRIKQFLVEQLSSASSAAASSSNSRTAAPAGNPRPLRFRPKEVQNLQQLQAVLQKHANSLAYGNCCLKEVAASAVQLVSTAANQTARQQVIEKNSPAFTVLLDEGYRAGVMLQSCAALRAALSIKVVTHVQLAQVLLVVRRAAQISLPFGSSPLAPGQDDQTCRDFAWQHLWPFYTGTVSSGSSSSSPPWQLPAAQVGSLMVACYTVTASALDPKLVPFRYEFVPVAIPVGPAAELLARHLASGAVITGPFFMGGANSTAQRCSASSVTQITVEDSSSTSDCIGTRFDSKAALRGSSTTGSTSSSGGAGGGSGSHNSSSSKQKSMAKGGGSAGGGSKAGVAAAAASAPKSGSRGSQSASGSCRSVRLPKDTAAPLDDCALLTTRCEGFTPVLASTSEWVAARTVDSRQLRASIKQFLSAQVAAAAAAFRKSSGSGSAVDSSTRRTIVPRTPSFLLSLQQLCDMLQGTIERTWPEMPAMHSVAQLVTAATKELARELVIERSSAAYDVLWNCAYSAGVLIAGCGALQQQLEITLSSETQLREALLVCCDGIQCCTLSLEGGEERSAATKRQVAGAIYHKLRSIAASQPGPSSPIGGSMSSNKNVGSSGSGSSETDPPCSLDVAWRVLSAFQGSAVVMVECDGVITSEWQEEVGQLLCEQMLTDPDVMTQLASMVKMTPTQLDSMLGLSRPGATAGSSKSDAGGDEGTWGKGQALAGLKGLFQKPPGSKPVTVRASSSGLAVASTPQTPAGADTVSAKGAAAAAAAAAPQAQTPVAMTVQSTAGGAGTGKKAATAPELLVEANLKQRYCSPEGLGQDVVQALPEDSLTLLTKLKLHTTHREQGWNALHYACAGHRYELAKHLLKAGAPVNAPENQLGLHPLHLACLGRICSAKQFKELIAAGEQLASFKEFAGRCGPACLALVELLLQFDADPSARAEKCGSPLFGLTPLHVIACWHKDGYKDTIFGNPFVGKAAFMSKGDHLKVIALNAALLDLQHAQAGQLSARAASTLDIHGLDDGTRQPWCTPDVYTDIQDSLDWDGDMERNLQHVRAAKVLLDHDADYLAEASYTGETALFFAAQFGNAALTDLLLRAGADPEHIRWDGARVLDVAADLGFPRVGWTLLCLGAQAVPVWEMGGKVALNAKVLPVTMSPAMLVCNAVQCEDTPWNLRFLERLLADGAPIDEVWAETGETAPLMAIGYGDADMVRVLTMAGANVHMTMGPRGITPIAQVVLKGGGNCNMDMLQALLEAGSDIHSWVDDDTEYDLLQTAANAGDTDAVIKLVEAGASWKLPMGKRVKDGSVYYVPEILSIHVPNLRLSYMEGRLRLAEKTGRSKRAAIAAALEPWLAGDINPDCKEATLRTCTTAGVTPSRPQLQPAKAQPAPQKPSGRSWPSVVRPTSADRSAAAAGLGQKQVVEQDDGDVDDIDALLAAIESVGGGGGGAVGGSGSGSSKASKKKKKETAAQREAKKQQQLRAAVRLQQQRDEEEEEGQDDADGFSQHSADTHVPAALADIGRAAPHQAGPVQQPEQGQQQDQQQQQQQPANAQRQVLQPQPEPQQVVSLPKEEPQKQQKSKKGKGGQQQGPNQHKADGLQQAELTSNGCSSSGTGAAHTRPRTPAPQSAESQQVPAIVAPVPAAAAAAAPARHGEAVTSAVAPASSVPSLAAPAAQAAAAAPVGTAGHPVQQTAARAFLPPHLRVSMPAAAAVAAPAAVPAAAVAPPAIAAVQQPALPAYTQQQGQGHGSDRTAQMKQRMVQLAQEHQLREQQQPPPPAAPRQQEPAAVKGPSTPLPALPHAMMALLSGSGQQPATAAPPPPPPARPAGTKRQMPAAPAVRHGPTALQQQHHHHHHQEQQQQQQQQGLSQAGAVGSESPRPAGASSDAAGAAGKGPRLCVVCSERRRNVLLIPCNHLVLCHVCADQLHARGALSSCPQCSKRCKQRIRVHQS